MTREEIKQVKMTNQEAIEILRDTPIDLRSPREDDIHTLYAKAQMMAIEALQERPKGRWIELPCEVGSTVWCIYENKVHKAVACKVSVAKGLYNFNLTRIEAEFDIIDSFYNDGRTQKMAIYAIYLETVFLTKEEAEKALADMKGE